ncbi:MAG: hypothetical protein AAF515_12955 [Pseudomonadota bacterium]
MADPSMDASDDFRARADALESVVRAWADDADNDRRPHPEVAQAFAASGLYRLAAPAAAHGADADALTQFDVLEIVSRFDGSAGWNLMIGMENFGLLAPAMSGCLDLIADPLRVLASSTAAVGAAEREGDGWRVRGRWQFVSGIHNATLFGATVRRHEDGEKLPGNVYALIEAPDYKVHDTWNTTGMRGSGSHDVSVDGVWIPDHRIASSIAATIGDSTNLRFPRGPRLAYNKVGVAIGIGRAAIDAFVDLALWKRPRFTRKGLRDRPLAQRTLATAEARWIGARAGAREVIAALWEQVDGGVSPSAEALARFQAVCCNAVLTIAELVDDLALVAGTSANQVGEPLERIARDAAVVRQHLTVAPHHLEDAGKLLLGLEPEEAMLAGIAPRMGSE